MDNFAFPKNKNETRKYLSQPKPAKKIEKQQIPIQSNTQFS